MVNEQGKDILVGADPSSLERFRAHLFVLVGDKVNTKREFIDTGTLAPKVEDTDLGVRHTTVEARLWIRLQLQC